MNATLKDFADKTYYASMQDDYLATIIPEGARPSASRPGFPRWAVS